MKREYPYLNDADFLLSIDTQHLQKEYIKITLLDWEENPIKEIQGKATSGSLSINGDSACRRTSNVSLTVDRDETAITNIDNLISINKKIYLEVGIENLQNKYKDEKIIWFPQGVYVVTSCSMSHSSNGLTLSMQLRDKSCLLDGSVGGIIPASTQFDEYDTVDEVGHIILQRPPIVQIVRELVNHFGNEPLGKIIISDIPLRIKSVMKWIGNTPVYRYWDIEESEVSQGMTTSYEEASSHDNFQRYSYGDDIGFIYSDFTYPGELIANPGDNICTILDKIKSTLGNFEYFYDIEGNFHFQEIKNYLNTTQATIELDNLKNEDYLVDMSKGTSVYKFIESPLVSSYSHTPKYADVKNDYVVWGQRDNGNGTTTAIRYHLAIDKKPETGHIYNVFFYLDPEDGLTKAKVPLVFTNKAGFPLVGMVGVFYLDSSTNIIYLWNPDTQSYVTVGGNDNLDVYDTRSDFPETGVEGVLYVTRDTKQRYSWSIDKNSQHYLDVQAEKREVHLEYLEDIALLEDTLEQKKDDLKNAELLLQHLGTIEENEQRLAETEVAKEEDEELLELRQFDLLELQAEYEAAETEEERERIGREILQVQFVIDNLEAEIDKYDEAIAEYTENIRLIPITEQEIIDLNAEVVDYQGQISSRIQEYNEDMAELDAAAFEYVEVANLELTKVKTTDWRSELYLQGAAAEPLGLNSNYYYPELAAEWPKLYDLRANEETDPITGETYYTGAFYEEVLARPWDVDYFLDFIDSTAAISQFSIGNIGRRSKIENKDEFNCVFEPDVPDFVLIESGKPDTASKRQECEERGQAYIQIDSAIYNTMVLGGNKNGCFTEIKNLLYNYTRYNGTIQLQGLPIFHLEPNTRIEVIDRESDIYGDYIITSMSIPLAVSGTMSLSASKAVNKL